MSEGRDTNNVAGFFQVTDKTFFPRFHPMGISRLLLRCAQL